jgi:hypothetical protein
VGVANVNRHSLSKRTRRLSRRNSRSPESDSTRRPLPYPGSALPTELSGRVFCSLPDFSARREPLGRRGSKLRRLSRHRPVFGGFGGRSRHLTPGLLRVRATLTLKRVAEGAEKCSSESAREERAPTDGFGLSARFGPRSRTGSGRRRACRWSGRRLGHAAGARARPCLWRQSACPRELLRRASLQRDPLDPSG